MDIDDVFLSLFGPGRVEPCLEQAVEPLTGVQRRRRAAVAACPQAGRTAATPVGDPHPPRRNIAQTLSTDYGVISHFDGGRGLC